MDYGMKMLQMSLRGNNMKNTKLKRCSVDVKWTRMWANTQRDGHPAVGE